MASCAEANRFKNGLLSEQNIDHTTLDYGFRSPTPGLNDQHIASFD
jgi:hypothetical protein